MDSRFLEEIITVVGRALGDRPYVVAATRVYRMTSPRDMEAVPMWESGLVLKLIDGKQFVVGPHWLHLRCGDHTRPVRPVGVSVTIPGANAGGRRSR